MVSVGGYELLGRVGEGATATVWKARDVSLGREVALKQVPSGSAESVAALRSEAAVLAGLDDEHVVQVFGFFEEGGSAYLVEQWIEGATLAAVLARGAKLSDAQALGVCRGALLGLSATHSRGVVHGDVSASNILVDTDGVSRLIDFGRGGSGTPAYRAPEVAAGRPATAASDVYAAAAVLVHLLTGVAARPPSTDRVDGGLKDVLGRALAVDPAERYPDAAAFLADLEQAAERRFGPGWWTQAGVGALVVPAIVAVTGVGVSAGGGATVVAAGAARSTPRLLIAGGAAAAIVIAGGVIALAATDDDSPVARLPAPVSSSQGTNEEVLAPSTPDPAEVLESSQPTGAWTVRASRAKQKLAGGGTRSQEGPPARTWTFTPTSCDASRCTGTIASSSGLTFPYAWDGKALDVTRQTSAKEPKEACTDNVTGEVLPIGESAVVVRYAVSYDPFTGPSTKLVSEIRTTYDYAFFGTCAIRDDNVISEVERQVLTPPDGS